ncbi:unnamed protein product [Linum trigynum]|uniref:Uncharacterized protein n=1 Tax=Linum trigynum TaxID=586398 RepID=A0AAV2FYP0_9ROSI
MGDKHGFAKVLVELTVDSECPDHVLLWLDDDSSIRIGVTYCNLPPVCQVCHLFGITRSCAEHQGKKWVAKPVQMEQVVSTDLRWDVMVEEVIQEAVVDFQGASEKGKEVVVYDDPQLMAIFTSSASMGGGQIVPQNLEKSFQEVATSSSPKLPSEDEFQRVVNGARPRVWLSQDSSKGNQVSHSSFSVLGKLGDKEASKVQDAPRKKEVKKDVKKGGGKPPTSK